MALSDNEDSNRPEFYHEDDDDDDNELMSQKRAAEEMDDDEIGELNMDELGSKVWLVKVPGFLAEKWKKQKKDGVQLGKMRIYHKPDKTASEIAIILNDSEDYKDIPKEYRMNVVNEKVSNMYIFSEARDPNEIIKPTSSTANKAVPIAMTGTVHHDCSVVPHYTDEYKRIMHKRAIASHDNNRRVQTIGLDQYKDSLIGFNNGGFDTSHKKPKTEPKKARMERKELMDMLFAAFTDFQYWSFKGLVEHTNQPSAYLKEVLLEIAFLHKRGPYTSNYSLKPEFRKDNINPPPGSVHIAEGSTGEGSSAIAEGSGGKADPDNLEDEDDFEDV
ncbi:hypothetical protein LPJ73_000568 [Coemansia sp. RSA 2703]|nr:hypothetical protein LPJ73_000568 [Coemansia sp. RSA 2703]KAJ2377306.1 hypothetical protein IW150_001460 [Coemansia sp. RSA 2607]KAJ2398046.1 hypothetical protein GGI05_000318 [Coemansia sp. RSA 2603]